MANILVIDDDKDIQRLIELALKRAGHTIDQAFDGHRGLALAEEFQPDLIVCDVMMPKMTGYEFCRQARSTKVLKNTPIIIFSARFQPVDKQTALEAGATDYLSKSMAPSILVNRINELLPADKPQPATGIVGLFSLRGGVGTTSLSVNLASVLAQKNNAKVALVDLVDLSGHAALMMGLRPVSSVPKLLESMKNDLSPAEMQDFMIMHESGVQLLSSPLTFAEKLAPDAPSRLMQMLNTLEAACPVIVLDVPHLIEPDYLPVLQLLDKVLLVISTDMPSIQSAAIALQGLINLGVSDSKIMLIVNQVAQHNALPLAAIQKAVKRPVAAHIPFDPNMTRAVNAGKPLVLTDPQSPAAAALAELAAKLFD